MMLCVTCGEATEERVHEDVTADVCLAGHGLWLAECELLSAVRTTKHAEPIGNSYEEGRSLSVAADHDVEAGDEVRECPMCHAPLGSVRYAFTTDVVVDVCAKHGVWLDAGELEQLEAWAEQRAAADSPETAERIARVHSREHGEAETIEYRTSVFEWLGSMLRR